MKTLHEECKRLDFTGLISVNGGYNASYAATSAVRISPYYGLPIDVSPYTLVASGGGKCAKGFPGDLNGYPYTHNPELAPIYAAIREAYAAYSQSCVGGSGFQGNYSILCGLVSRNY